MSTKASLSQAQMLDVMALADGELEGEELKRIQELVETDPEAKELLASLHAIGDGVRSTLDYESVDVRDAVMARLHPNDLDKARLRRSQRRRIAIVSASIVAIAAAVMFYVRGDFGGGTGPQSSATGTAPQTMLAQAGQGGVQVDFVDTPSAVSVFYVPSHAVGAESDTTTDTAPSVVVWVPDDTAPKPEETP